jgi:heterotetrameric sarcosine oxidase gamma subunit
MATDLRPAQLPNQPPPVRRSALESVHRTLAGNASTNAQRWPTSYGDPDGERRAVASAIGLGEPGLFDKLLVRGPGALTEARAAGLRAEPGRVTPADEIAGVNVWAIAEDELFLLVLAPPAGSQIQRAVSVPRLASSLAGGDVAVTDLSSGWSVLRLVGPNVRSLLEELIVSDVSADAIADLRILQVTMANCRVVMARQDLGVVPGFTLLVARDEAEHLWDVFVERGAAYGLRPVGALALQPGTQDGDR